MAEPLEAPAPLDRSKLEEQWEMYVDYAQAAAKQVDAMYGGPRTLLVLGELPDEDALDTLEEAPIIL